MMNTVQASAALQDVLRMLQFIEVKSQENINLRNENARISKQIEDMESHPDVIVAKRVKMAAAADAMEKQAAQIRAKLNGGDNNAKAS